MDKTKDAADLVEEGLTIVDDANAPVPDHLMRAEYGTWLDFMHEFYRVTGATEEEVNARDGRYDQLFCLLRTWGEYLAALRRVQPRPNDLDDRGFPVWHNHN